MGASHNIARALCLVPAFAGAAAAETLAERCAAGVAAGDFRTCAAAVAERPDDAAVRRLYAQSLAKAADYDGAVREYRAVTRIAPNDGRAFYEFGWMLAFVRRYQEAVAPIEEAIRLRPDHTPSYRAATIIYQIIKRPEDALRVALAGARLGDTVAMFDVYFCYADGTGTAKNDGEAYRWLSRAAEAGHVAAMDRLVAVFLHGELGQAPDERKAEEWATKARIARNGKL